MLVPNAEIDKQRDVLKKEYDALLSCIRASVKGSEEYVALIDKEKVLYKKSSRFMDQHRHYFSAKRKMAFDNILKSGIYESTESEKGNDVISSSKIGA